MAERYGADLIYSKLNIAGITAIVGTSIYEGLLVPQSDVSLETINFYRTGPVNGRLEYDEYRWSIDCRSKTYTQSRDLATLVFTALNRTTATVNGKFYFSVVEILTTLPPVDDTDVYNTPVELYLRRK